MKTPHKHAALIKQWADGATIQFKPHNCLHDWKEADGIIGWHDWCDYRVKPEPKPNVVRYACLDIDCNARVNARSNYFSGAVHRCENLMVVFDGETGKLKDAQVLASSGE